MHDYDVGVTGLSVPPPSAFLQAYRPAISIRNNGVHPALAVGYIRIYSAGLLIFTSDVYSGTIAPGDTKDAQADNYWTPPAVGSYLLNGYVTCEKDQYDPNNNLPPTWIAVTSAPPPPPPEVQAHAAQHEDGGLDEINADGLHGKLSDAQTPLGHKLSHQAAGSDQLDVTGLNGILAQGQAIADHHETHEDGGGDELYVGGLHGELVDNQPAKVHDNAKHDPNYTTVTEFGNHLSDTTDVHAVATNLEQTANKGEPDGYPELDVYGHVPPNQLAVWTTPPPANDKALLPNQTFGYPLPAEHSADEHDSTVEATANKGQASGYAGLDSAGHVPESQLATVPDPPPDASDALTLGSGWAPANPVAHHLRHEAGGDDEVEVAPGAHHTSHENGGDDEVSIAGLSGAAADAQKAEVLQAHAGQWTCYGDDPETTIAQLVCAGKWMNTNFAAVLRSFGTIHNAGGPGASLSLKLKIGEIVIEESIIDCMSEFDRLYSLTDTILADSASTLLAGIAMLMEESTGAHELSSKISNSNQAPFVSGSAADLTVTAQFTGLSHTSMLVRYGYSCNGTGPQA